MKELVKDYINIENEFFDLDHEKKIAYMELEFEKPSDIFNKNVVTKKPVLSDDFIDWTDSAFMACPKTYKIDLKILFNDLEGYTDEDLNDIFFKNVMFEIKKNKTNADKKRNVAFLLIIIGILFFMAMLLFKHLWTYEGIAKDIVIYIADIATTVTFWEAMTILVVENAERRSHLRNLYSKFDKIEFKLKDK